MKKIISLVLCLMLTAPFFSTDYHTASAASAPASTNADNNVNNSGVYSFGLKEWDENSTAGGNILTTGNIVKRASHHWSGAVDFVGTGTSNDNIKIALTDIQIFTNDTGVTASNSVSWSARIRNGPAEIADRWGADNAFYSGTALTPINGISNGMSYTDNNIIEIAAYGTGDVFVEVWVTTYGADTPENEFDRGDRNNYLIKTFVLTIADDSEHDELGADFLLDTGTSSLNLNNLNDEIKLAPSLSLSKLTIDNVFVYDFDTGTGNNGYKVNVPVYTWSAAVTKGSSITLVNENGEPITDNNRAASGNNASRAIYIKPYETGTNSIKSGKSTVTVEITNTATSMRKIFEIRFDVSAAVNDFSAEPQVLVYNANDPDKKPVNIFGGINGYVNIEIDDLYAVIDGVNRYFADFKDFTDSTDSTDFIDESTEVTDITNTTDTDTTDTTEEINGTDGTEGIEAKISLARKTSGLNIPFTDPMTTINEYYRNNGWEVSGSNITKNIKDILNGGTGTIQIPYEFLTFIDDAAAVQIEIGGAFDKYTVNEINVEEITKKVTVRRISEADNGKFISFGFEAEFDNNAIEDYKGKISKESTVPNTAIISEINFETDKDGKYKTGDYANPLDNLKDKKINISGFTADILDVNNAPAYKRTIPDPNNNYNNYYGYDNPEYGFKIASITVSPVNSRVIEPIPAIADGDYIDVINTSLDLTLTGTAGTVTVTVKAESNKKTGVFPNEKALDTIEIRFNITVESIGIFPEDAGKIVSFNLRRENKVKIYTSETNTGSELTPLYLKPRFGTDVSAANYEISKEPPSLTINIDEVRISDPSQTGTDFTKSLSNFDCLIDVIAGTENFESFGELHFDEAKEKSVVLGNSGNSSSIDTDRSAAYYGLGSYLLESNRGKADIKLWTKAFAGSRNDYDNSCDADTVIAVTVIPVEIQVNEDGEIIRIPVGSDKWEKVYFRIVVNKLGGEFDLIVDFDSETLGIERYTENGTGINKEIEPYEFDDKKGIEYMYALKAAADGAKQTAEQWQPVLGSTIDISSLIPKSGNSVYRIAVRKFGSGDDIMPQEDGSYSVSDRRMIELKARRTVSSAEKKSVVYDKTKGMLILNSSKETAGAEVLYKVGLSEWASVTLTDETGISTLSQYHPLGSTVEIKFKDPYGEKFASASFKIKIPKAAKSPKIRSDRNMTKLSGFSGKMSWSAGPKDENDTEWSKNEEKWLKCLKGAIPYKNLQEKFPGLQEDGNGYYNLYLRTDASGNNLDSAPVIFKIPANKYLP